MVAPQPGPLPGGGSEAAAVAHSSADSRRGARFIRAAPAGLVPSGGRHQPCRVAEHSVADGSATRRYTSRRGSPYDTVSFLSDYGTGRRVRRRGQGRDPRPRPPRRRDRPHPRRPAPRRAGRLLALVRGVQYLPSGVVARGGRSRVGTERRAIAVEVADGEGVLVGPDNGLLAPAVAMAGGAERAVELTNTDVPPGRTGRDLRRPGRVRARPPPISATASTSPSWARRSTR